jgi:adenosylcobinamide-GDP ribazoletransferase
LPLADLRDAFALLTRLPLSRFAAPGARRDRWRCAWAFPLVGLVVNAFGATVYWVFHRLGVPPLAGASWALAATMLATGALHDDGLADTVDGFGGGATPAGKLEIMRDSRIGCYGALALLLAVITRVAAIASLDDPRRVTVAMIVAGMLGRGGILVLTSVLRPARADGLAATMGTVPLGSVVLGLAIAIAAPLSALSVPTALIALILAAGVSLVVARLAQTQVGGYTGDVLGAVEVIIECVILTVAASVVEQ